MSFDIYLIQSSASPSQAQFERDVRAAIASDGGRIGSDGELVTLPDGFMFELYGGSAFMLTGLDPAVCKIVFDAAKRTNAFIVAGSPTLKVKDAAGRPPRGLTPIRVVADPKSLCVHLEEGFGVWRGYANQVRKSMDREGARPARSSH